MHMCSTIQFSEDLDKQLEKNYKYLNINHLERNGIVIDPHKYDFVFSHIPVGKLMQIPRNFNYKVIFTKEQDTTFYIHIPFCLRECAYCYFVKDISKNVRCKNNFHYRPKNDESYQGDDRVAEYLYYLNEEFKIFSQYFEGKWERIQSINIGGGTPSFLSIDELEFLFDNIINPLKDKIKRDDLEVAMEIHPELMLTKKCQKKYVDSTKLNKIIELGVTRLSFGIQTFDNYILQQVCRNNEGHIEMLDELKNRSFQNWNLDMIYGLPYQTMDSLKKDISMILKYSPPSVTWYQLWYSPRKKEREIRLKMKEFEDHLPSKEEIIRFKLLIDKCLCDNGYTNISGDWYVKKAEYYTNYEKFKIEALGNVGIGIGIYQYYGDYVYENTSGNGQGNELTWKDYYERIANGNLPIKWIRKVNEAELKLREIVMGLKGLQNPKPFNRRDIDKLFKGEGKLDQVNKRINQLIGLDIFKEERGEIFLNQRYYLLRDYIVIYLLEKYGWNIEKEGMLESMDGIDVFKAKDTYRLTLKDKSNNESLAFFAAVFNELTGKYELNYSYNYIIENNNVMRKRIGETLTQDTVSFSFLKTFYNQTNNLKVPACIVLKNVEQHDVFFDFPYIQLKENETVFIKELIDFLKSLELIDEKSSDIDIIKAKNFDYIFKYYSELNSINQFKNSPNFFVYHIPFLKNYGIGGIELASSKQYTKKELYAVRNSLLPFFIDRISGEINAYEYYNIRKHALKSAISSIMARNLSHIHGSHIEPGIQYKMKDFRNLLK